MRIIKISPCKRFGGSWACFEMPGVEPTYNGPNGKQDAIHYAVHCRFGGSRGEVHICDDEAGEHVVEIIRVDGGDIISPVARILPNDE